MTNFCNRKFSFSDDDDDDDGGIKKFYLTSKTWMKVRNSIPILDFLLIALQMFDNILLLYFVNPLNCFFFQRVQLVNKISAF